MKARERAAWATWRQVVAAVSRLKWPLAVFLALLAVGTFVFYTGRSQPNPVRALVYSLNLITFQLQPSDVPDSLPLQLVSFALIVGGVIALAGGAAKIVDYMTDEQERQNALASTYRDHIVVCGVGNIGYRVVTELMQFGESVVVVNSHDNEDWMPELKRAQVPVIVGDARKRDTLLRAGVNRASAIIPCTSDELTNLDVALDAREINPDIKVVLRMFDQTLARKVSKGFNIKTAFSVSALAAPAFAVAATRTNVDFSFRAHGELLNVTTATFGERSPFVGKTLAEIEQALNCSVVGRSTAAGVTMHPSKDDVVRAGDAFMFIGSLDAIKALNASL